MTAKPISVSRVFAGLSVLFSASLLPAAGFAASVVWNPLEDKYDAQLSHTVMIGPKGCHIERVAKDLSRDMVEAVMLCQLAQTPELFAQVYPSAEG